MIRLESLNTAREFARHLHVFSLEPPLEGGCADCPIFQEEEWGRTHVPEESRESPLHISR